MKLLASTSIIISMISINTAYATGSLCSTAPQIVPFQNVSVGPNCNIPVTYAFGSNPLIFCYESSLLSAGLITWPYRGVTQAAAIPIFLKTSAVYSGSFADPSGSLALRNSTKQTLSMNCVFSA